jgi:predicted nuclease with TOPRIM domain
VISAIAEFGRSEFVEVYNRGYRDAIKQAQEILDVTTADRHKLRQAVRDLTASSEKLRQINQKATQKAIECDSKNQGLHKTIATLRGMIGDQDTAIYDLKQQNAELQRPRQQYTGGNMFSYGTCDPIIPIDTRQENGRLKTELERTAAQLKACLAENQKLEQEKANLRHAYEHNWNRANHFAVKFQEQCTRSEQLEQELIQLRKDRGFTQPDQQRLRNIIHAAAEIIHGCQIDSVTLNPA